MQYQGDTIATGQNGGWGHSYWYGMVVDTTIRRKTYLCQKNFCVARDSSRVLGLEGENMVCSQCVLEWCVLEWCVKCCFRGKQFVVITELNFYENYCGKGGGADAAVNIISILWLCQY